MKRTPLSRKTPLRAKSELKRGTVRLRPVNRKRLAKLRAQQFGTDGYREYVQGRPAGDLPLTVRPGIA